MNTAIQHSPLESFLLFRGIELHGLGDAAFARISDALQNNFLVRNNSNYDAARLKPKALQELFLNLLWEELKSESDNFVRSDGELSELSPASKKRKLQPPPPPTLTDARHHINKIEAIYLKLQDIYIRHTIKDIRRLENDYDQVEEEIRRLMEDVERTRDGSPATVPKTSNGVAQDYAVKRDSVQVNGISATAKPAPKPPTQISPPVPPPIPALTPTPALPQATPQALSETPRWQPTRNGSLPVSHAPPKPPVTAPSSTSVAAPVMSTAPAPTPAPALAPSLAPVATPGSVVAQTLSPVPVSSPAVPATPTPPALAPVPVATSNLGHAVAPVPSLPNSDASPRPGQQNTTRPRPPQPQEAPKAPNGTPQVHQPPHGIPLQQPPQQQFTPPPVADGLQRPDQADRPKPSPVPLAPGAQQDPALKREPLYQSHPKSAMHPMPHGQQQQQQQQHQHQQQLHSQPLMQTTQPPQSTQAPHVLQPQRPSQPPQHVVHSAPRPLQPQTSKPLQQQVLSTAPQTPAHPQYQTSQPPQPPQHPQHPQHHQHPHVQPQHLQHPQHPQLPQLAQAPQVPQSLPPHLAHIRPAPENQSYAKQPWPSFAHGPQNRVNQPPNPSYQNYPSSGVRSPVQHSPVPSPTSLHPRPSQLAPPQPHQHQQAGTQPHAPPPLQAPSPFSQRNPSSGPPSPALPLVDSQRGYNSPYHQHPRVAVPDRLHQNRPPVATTPVQPTARFALIPSAPHTPVPTVPLRLVTGSGTMWSKASTPSTPKNGTDRRFNEHESPAPEPLSPVLRRAVLPSVAPRDEIKSEDPTPERAPQPTAPLPPVETPHAKRKPGRPRGSQKPQEEVPSVVEPDESTHRSPERPQELLSEKPAEIPPQQKAPEEPSRQRANQQKSPSKEVLKLNVDPEPTKIKDEVTTPNHGAEAWDTTADESVASRRQPKRQTKRKRDELSPTPVQTSVESQVPVTPEASGLEPNTVLWTRSFHKVSASAMEQIVRHRLANMFAVPIRERDAPGYHKRIAQPQDLKSIRAAIMTGNRAAAQATAALPGGDPGTSAVRLPISEELIPPKAIINSSQLDRELAHMFANAIMYNPDHGHGPGPAFMVQEDDENNDQDGAGEDHGGAAAHPAGHHGQEHVLGYKVDEYGVVHDTRAMFQDVDKWLSELRSAEIERGKPPATGTSTRQASVAQGEQSSSSNTATSGTAGSALGADITMDDADEQTATEPETTVKRRRTTRNA